MSSLRVSHPNMWLVCIVTLVLHGWMAISRLVTTDAGWTAPTYDLLFEFMPRAWWGIGHGVAAVVLATGFFARRVDIIRFGLLVGGVLVGLRLYYAFEALAKGVNSGYDAVPIWIFIAVVHAAALREPASNPANQA